MEYRKNPVDLRLDDKYADNVVHQRFYIRSVEPEQGIKNVFKYDKLFVQLDVLSGEGDDYEKWEWQERARWIKYEQNVEEGADRWGRAHISSLSFHSLISLRRLLAEGVVMFDLNAMDFLNIVNTIVHQMTMMNLISEDDQASVRKTLLLKHKHVDDNEKGWKFYQPRKSIVADSQSRRMSMDLRKVSIASIRSGKENFSEYVDAQATLVLVGTDETLEAPTTAFVRLAESIQMPNITEVPIPVKFLFVLLGPSRLDLDYIEIGRSIGTLMSNKEFHNIADEAEHRKDLLKGIHEYLNDSIILSPNVYQKDVFSFDDLRLKNETLKLRKQRMSICVGASGDDAGDKLLEINHKLLDSSAIDPATSDPCDTGLKRTRKFYGGLFNDIRRRYPKYWSDIKDGLNFQCLAAIVFMSFAQISGTIAFGGLMDAKTGKRIGIPETLMASSIGGIFVALLGGQPLLIAASTGPILLFDAGLFSFCQDQQIDFLAMRTWIGIWLSAIALVFVAFEASVLIRLFSRFALEIFAAVISLLFIAESLINLYNIYKAHPLLSTYGMCEIDPNNDTIARLTTGSQYSNQPNTALLCTILMFGTFVIAYSLNEFRNSDFLTKSIRNALGNFAVPLAIAITVFADYSFSETVTKKLDTPQGLQPTYDRSWFVNPNQVTLFIAALSSVPSVLLFILLFMEVSIAERIVAKPEYRTVKGGGFHLDVLLICLVNTGTCFLGLPWVSVALVRTVTHCSSVIVYSTNNPPGEKPVIIGLKEQRLTNLFLSILTGASVMMAPVLGIIPTAVIFGVFFFMGVGGLNGIQFIDRINLLFKQVSKHPQVPYVRRVRTSKMHLYTVIQLCWFVLLWGVNYSHIALSFALFVILMIPFRYFIIPRIFKPEELAVLDASGDDKSEAVIDTQPILLSNTNR